MDAPGPQGDDALVVEKQLADGAIGGRVCSERCVTLKFGPIEGRDSALTQVRL